MYFLINELNKNIKDKLYLITIPLIIGGALGNLIDRVFRGYVVDFISFTLFNKEMAIFNVADILSSLIVGKGSVFYNNSFNLRRNFIN